MLKDMYKVTAADMGLTEDEYNNFLIDIFTMPKDVAVSEGFFHEYTSLTLNGEIVSSPFPTSVTITLKPPTIS